ncbi:MAG TPA: hypothetical protein VGB54_10740 [Allosphingosinicella sp.]|jgi:hypothetical protein
MMSSSLLAATLILAQPASPPLGQRTGSPDRVAAALGLGPDAGEDPAIAAAAAFPLGSKENPVRVGGPAGERDYLARLRCADGSAPVKGARTDQGVGAFGSVVSGYALECGGVRTMLIMDMYHEEHRENRAPPGFTIQPG